MEKLKFWNKVESNLTLKSTVCYYEKAAISPQTDLTCCLWPRLQERWSFHHQQYYGLSPFKLEAQTRKILSSVVLPYRQVVANLVKTKVKIILLPCHVYQDWKIFFRFPMFDIRLSILFFVTVRRLCLSRHFDMKK